MRQDTETDLIEMIAQDRPHLRPFQSDSSHVIVGDLDELLQTKDSGLLSET